MSSSRDAGASLKRLLLIAAGCVTVIIALFGIEIGDVNGVLARERSLHSVALKARRQRELCQNVLWALVGVVDATGDAAQGKAFEDLQARQADWTRGHDDLERSIDLAASDRRTLDDSFRRMRMDVQAVGRGQAAVADQKINRLIVDQHPYLQVLDDVIHRSATASSQGIQRQQSTATLLLIATLGLSLGLVLFILRPAIRATVRALEQLQASRAEAASLAAQLEAMFAATTYGFLACDQSGTIIRANAAAKSLLGYAPQELAGHRSLAQLDVPCLGAEPLEALFAAAKNDEARDAERTFRRKDGSLVPILLTLSLLTEQGTATGFVAIVRDLSAAKEVERRLAEEEESRRSILEALPDALLRLDANGVCVDFHATADQGLGLAAEQILGRRFSETVPPAVAAEIEALLEQARRTGGVQTLEYRVGGRRETHEYEARVAPIGQGGLIVVLRDITPRKQVEQTLRQREAMLRQAEISARYGSWEYDIATQRLLYSAGMYRLVGLDAEKDELSFERYLTFVHPEDRTNLRDHADALEFEGVPYDLEYRVTLPDGTLKNLHSIAYCEDDEQGDLVRLFGTVQDVTERKRTESELVEAREAAIESARLKSEFLANVSHEIRTPMNGVIGMVYLLLETNLNERQQVYARTIQSSAENLLHIINDVLDFSKIESGKMTVEQVEFDLRETLEEICAILAPNAHEKGLELSCILPATFHAAVTGDPVRLRQVLTNLVGNAIKFTDQGEIALETTVLREDAKSQRIRFQVRDTGIGIPADRLGSIFDSFVQADGTTTRKFGGTGLGLTISRQLTELMGGRLTVESTVGTGSIFSIELDLPKAQKAMAAGSFSLQGREILIVADNLSQRSALYGQVCSWGCTAEVATTGEEAMDLLDARGGRAYPAMILDVGGADGNTDRTARLIKSHEIGGALPIVLLTTSGARNQNERRATGLYDTVLPKPVRQSQLFDALTKVCDIAAPPPVSVRSGKDSDNLFGGFERPLRILVAEDNPVNRMVVTELLARHGCEAVAAVDGLAAVAEFRLTDFDAILMDVQMPRLDGFEATARIREMAATIGRNVPIIAMTANALVGDRERCLAAGMDDYISKPVNPRELLRVLEKWATLMPRTMEDPKPTHAPDPSVLNVQRLDEVCAGNDSLKRRVLEEYVRVTPALVDRLQGAAAGHNGSEVYAAAHTLKGSSRTIGAEHLGDLCADIESVASAGGENERMDSLMTDIRLEFGKLLQSIHDYLGHTLA